MAENPNHAERLRKWLETQEADRLLRHVAQKVAGQIRSGYLRLADRNPADADLETDLCSDLAVFLLDRPARFPESVSDNRHLALILTGRFRNYLKDRNRKKENSPDRYLYKRAADILRNAESEGFHTRAMKNNIGSLFSRQRDSRVIGPITGEDLDTIAFPDGILDQRTYDAVNHRSAVLALAAHFWEEVTKRCGAGGWVEIRSLIEWIFRYIKAPLTVPAAEKTGAAAGERLSREGKNEPFFQYYPERVEMDVGRIGRWAEMIAARVEPEDGRVFLMRNEQNMTLDAIASKIAGLNSAAAVKYRIERVENQLRTFIMRNDLSWLSADDRNEEAMGLFIEKFVEGLKKRISAP